MYSLTPIQVINKIKPYPLKNTKNPNRCTGKIKNDAIEEFEEVLCKALKENEE
jgi:hypothetical protein